MLKQCNKNKKKSLKMRVPCCQTEFCFDPNLTKKKEKILTILFRITRTLIDIKITNISMSRYMFTHTHTQSLKPHFY